MATTTTMNATEIPSLRQSLVEVMSCPHSYAKAVIEGKQMPGGLQSARGTEIHRVMAQYIAHCASRRVPADWSRFDSLALGAGSEAARILNGLRDSYEVDHEHVYETELTLSTDEGEASGTLDVLLFPTPAKAKIEDFKSHPRPFDPDTFQSKLYPFLVFECFPQVEEVTFELVFVRYQHCRRSVTFTRSEDYAALKQQVANARARQVEIHERYAAGDDLPAYPGTHCQYCPLLQTPSGCPISEFNPHATCSLEERLRFKVWMEQVSAVNNQVLKDAVDASGKPVQIRDGNGRITQIGFNARESRQYPLPMVLDVLEDWQHASGEDLKPKLFVSSTKLNQFAGAKKRAVLDQALEDRAERVTKTRFEISAPAEQQETETATEWEE